MRVPLLALSRWVVIASWIERLEDGKIHHQRFLKRKPGVHTDGKAHYMFHDTFPSKFFSYREAREAVDRLIELNPSAKRYEYDFRRV